MPCKNQPPCKLMLMLRNISNTQPLSMADVVNFYAIAVSIFFPLTDFHSTTTAPINDSAAMASDT